MSVQGQPQDIPKEIFVKNGRFRLPGHFVLPRSTVVMTASPGPCLLLFREKAWEPIREKLLSYPMPDDASKHALINQLRRLLLGYARDIQVSGRSMIEIDADLLQFSGIQGRLLWVAETRHIELWHPHEYAPERRPRLFGNEP